jgi:hypothetical protein
MEKPIWARRRKPETDKAILKPPPDERMKGRSLINRRAEGMEMPTWAQRRKLATDKATPGAAALRPDGRVSIARWNPKGMRRSTGPQSMGATPKMNRSAKGGARSSPHYGGEGVLIHPPHQGVCGRHGTEEQRVTSGGLARFAGGTAISGPISIGEVESNVVSVVGLPSSTCKRGESYVTSNRQAEWLVGRRRTMTVGERQRGSE